MIGHYGTPVAFREALEARLANTAFREGADLQRLRRRVAFERLLARLFHRDDPPWLLKGGYSLEMRMPDRARSTLDLDLWAADTAKPDASSAPDRSPIGGVYDLLQQDAAMDLGDGFSFVIGRPREGRAHATWEGLRCNVDARLAGRTFVEFRLDVWVGDPALGEPEWVQGSGFLSFAGIPAPRVALYPAAQQFAEKLHAFTYPWQDRSNTRVRDLVDLVLLMDSGLLDLESVRLAVRATFDSRATHLYPPHPPEPPADWAGPFTAMAEELQLSARIIDEALRLLEDRWQEWGVASQSTAA